MTNKREHPRLACEGRSYATPCLKLLGDVRQLTETGSMNGMEDAIENGTCFSLPPFFNVNNINNMC